MDAYLRGIFYDPSHPASYGNARDLHRQARRDDLPYTLEEIRDWLSGEETYTLFRPSKIKADTPRVIVSEAHYQYDSDTINMSKYTKANSKYAYIVIIIDIFTRFVWLHPLFTLKGSEMAPILREQFRSTKPSVLRTDGGSEYVNSDVKRLLTRMGIRHWIVRNTTTKANYAERAILSLKKRITKHLYTNQTERWIDILGDVARAYNNNRHRSIGMTPAQALTADKVHLWQVQYGPKKRKKRKQALKAPSKPTTIFKFKVNDVVRVVGYKHVFRRAYQEQNTQELYKVGVSSQSNKAQYELKTWDNQPVLGRFYNEELVKVKVSDDTVYKIEKIVSRKTRNKQKGYIVRWLGWPARYDSWVSETELKDINS